VALTGGNRTRAPAGIRTWPWVLQSRMRLSRIGTRCQASDRLLGGQAESAPTSLQRYLSPLKVIADTAIRSGKVRLSRLDDRSTDGSMHNQRDGVCHRARSTVPSSLSVTLSVRPQSHRNRRGTPCNQQTSGNFVPSMTLCRSNL
jgi:hypothetical protein